MAAGYGAAIDALGGARSDVRIADARGEGGALAGASATSTHEQEAAEAGFNVYVQEQDEYFEDSPGAYEQQASQYGDTYEQDAAAGGVAPRIDESGEHELAVAAGGAGDSPFAGSSGQERVAGAAASTTESGDDELCSIEEPPQTPFQVVRPRKGRARRPREPLPRPPLRARPESGRAHAAPGGAGSTSEDDGVEAELPQEVQAIMAQFEASGVECEFIREESEWRLRIDAVTAQLMVDYGLASR